MVNEIIYLVSKCATLVHAENITTDLNIGLIM